MTTSIASALTLMAIGMITVFVVLFLVYMTGRILILLVNRWSSNAPLKKEIEDEISGEKIAIITAAVAAVTKGKASITNIQKQ